jgi:hypothetical protein
MHRSKVDDVYLGSKGIKREIRNKAVVREEDGLEVGADVCESKQAGAGTGFIKRGEDIVTDEGNGLAPAGVVVKVGQAKCEVELVA